LRRARHGERITLIPGNHDKALREYIDATFGDIRIAREWVHAAADGKRYLLVHGDEFDPVSRCSRFMAAVGHVAYTVLLRLNRQLASAALPTTSAISKPRWCERPGRAVSTA